MRRAADEHRFARNAHCVMPAPIGVWKANAKDTLSKFHRNRIDPRNPTYDGVVGVYTRIPKYDVIGSISL